MTPTPKLRFLEREQFVGLHEVRTVRILQQWWEDKNIVLSIHVEDRDGNPMPPPMRGEWRDVPLEAEE